MTVGLNFDIVKNLIDKYGSDVIITPVTKTISNISGDESLNESNSYEIKAYISRRTTSWNVDEAGLIKGGDAVMITKPEDNIQKDYVITWNDRKYRVQDVIDRDQGGGRIMFRTSNLFLIDDE